ncbi:hypothetical protein Ocin01_05567 [Orchesella cincta]|uniref:Uncharacterized protein n=1 Tax=Orchesella cincta TaxID=48709 RepID=A0A1D2N827_ORCCI|nr:hypothetical protein Ocin01_05567 [Orchesella cincta]
MVFGLGKKKPEEEDKKEGDTSTGAEGTETTADEDHGPSKQFNAGDGVYNAENDENIDSDHRKQCSTNLFKAFFPMRLFLMSVARFPLKIETHEDGTHTYTVNFKTPGGIYFSVFGGILIYVLIFGSWNLFSIILEFKISPWEKTKEFTLQLEYEVAIVKRHTATIVVLWVAMFHSLVETLNVYKKRHYFGHFLTFWSKAVHTLHMDIAESALKYAKKITITLIVFIAILLIIAFTRIAPITSGAPGCFGMLLLRQFTGGNVWMLRSPFTVLLFQIVGGILMALIFFASKSHIILFTYQCKLLRSAFGIWNARAYAAILRGGIDMSKDNGAATYTLLFKDHCVLLDLLEGSDRYFSGILESYFALGIFDLVVEFYFFLRAAKYGHNRKLAATPLLSDQYFIRPFDWLPALLIFCMSVYLIFVASKAAAEVAEEALGGLEIIRRKTLLGRQTDEELYFMLSMFNSFTSYRRIELSGGGYFFMNKEFIVGLFSTILSYFIILAQFRPVMDYHPTEYDENPALLRERMGRMLTIFEGVPEHHYLTTKQKSTFAPPLGPGLEEYDA